MKLSTWIALVVLSFPGLALAAGQGGGVSADLTHTGFGIAAVLLFVLGYALVPFENNIHLRKSKPVLLAAGLIWVLVALAYAKLGDTHTAHAAIKHSLLEYAELFLFLLSAMTYINALEERNVFQALRVYLVSKGYSLKTIFWITGLLAFVISPIADNLTTALLMGAVVMAVGGSDKKFVALACINIVVAANAGGAFSPFGDITTLMVWQKGKVAFGQFFSIFIPSVINWIIPAVIMSFAVGKETPAVSDETIKMKPGAVMIILLFLATIFTAVSFHNFLHLPPAAGMMLGLGYLGVFSYGLKLYEGRVERYDSILMRRDPQSLHPLQNLLRHSKKKGMGIDAFPYPAFIIDNDHVVTHWNAAMEKLSGVPASSVIGTRKHWHPFYSREQLVLADLVLERYSDSEIGRHYRGHHRKVADIKDAYETVRHFEHLRAGSKWLSMAAVPISDDEGNVTGALEVLQDFTEQRRRAEHFDLMRRVARAEWDTLLFFYGVILCVGGLSQFGYLTAISSYFYLDLGPTYANSLVGILSAIVDNIPVMFAVLTMDPSMSLGQWLLVTLTAGTGGSMLAIGSAAGVALMGTARGIYTFGAHLKWTPVIALGYVASIFCHLFLNAGKF
jgi:Na+/H+ antiporter NhaD/arsenite permease-like protein